jgi:predicted O-methyltransferase YrrM
VINLIYIFLIFVTALIFAYAYWLRKKINYLVINQNIFLNELHILKKEVNSGISETLNSVSLSALDFNFPVVLGGPSIDGQHARTLFHILVSNKPKYIIELGSGSSTMLIAKILKKMGHVPSLHISVDHEEKYLNITKEIAKLNSLDDQIQFEHCPLVKIDGYENKWYSNISDLAKGKMFDLVIVDGPPAYETGMGSAREPALDVLASHISNGGVLILDDANRPGELAVADAWIKKHKEFERFNFSDGKGVAIFTKKVG